MSGPIHLATRFFGALSPRPLDPDDDHWARERLLSGEEVLWDRMSLADRKHAAGVAREVDRLLGGAERPVIAAALLHDVGKVESGFGTFGRVLATIISLLAGHGTARDWRGPGLRGRVGTYVRHPEIGAQLLRDAGADRLTVAWAAEHHRPAGERTVPEHLAQALAAADDD